MVNNAFAAHGGRIVELYRFEGAGPVHADHSVRGSGSRARASMQLGINPDAWDFVPYPQRGGRP